MGMFVVFAGLQLLPIVPLMLLDLMPPPPALIISCSSLLALSALFANEWLFKPRARFGVFRALLVSLALALVIGAAAGITGLTLLTLLPQPSWPAGPPRLPMPMFGAALVGAVSSTFQVGLWAIAFVIPATVESERVQALEIRSLRLEAAEHRTQAELARLRGQLEPHFLLNTLNLVAGLVTMDPHKARAILGTLGELLGDALTESREVCRVDEELSWLRRYVDILCARHGDMLRVEWHVADDATEAVVPRLLLQPLIENAARHGALRRRGGGLVSIRVERQESDSRSWLVCCVQDDGPGLGEPRPGAIGLENVRRRIALSYPDGQLTLHSDAAGTRATIVLPFSVDVPRQSQP